MTDPYLHDAFGWVIVERCVLVVGRSDPAFAAHDRRLTAPCRLP